MTTKGLFRTVAVGITLVLLIASVAACTQSATPSTLPASTAAKPAAVVTPEKQIVLKFASVNAATQILPTYAYEPILKELEARSGGRLKIERYYSGSLGKADEQYEATLRGNIDFGKSNVPEGALYQVLTLGMLPYAATKDPNNVVRATDQLIKRGYGSQDLQGMKFFSGAATTPYSFMFKSKKPMTLEAFEGMKVRNPGSYLGDMETALKMVPVRLVAAEVYDAVAKNLVEGILWNTSSMVDFRLNELCRYVLVTEASIYTGTLGIMNEKTWNGLPKDIQNLFEELYTDKLMVMQLEALKTNDAPAEKTMRGQGIEFYSLPQAEADKAKKSILPVWEKAIKNLDTKGLPGKQVLGEFVSILKTLGENPPWTP